MFIMNLYLCSNLSLLASLPPSLLKEKRDLLCEGFMSVDIDFWTDEHRHEEFGAIMANLLANRYSMEDGESLFTSDATKAKVDSALFVTGKPDLQQLEFPLNFEHFHTRKTINNVTKWMLESTKVANVLKKDIGRLSADGGSNAIGSVQEFEVVGREEGGGRSNNMDFVVCIAHQNERSGGYTSGAVKFATEPNNELGAVLKKNHATHGLINRNSGRVKQYREVQESKQRSPPLGVDLANEVRWNGKRMCQQIFLCCIICLLTTCAFCENVSQAYLMKSSGVT